MEAKVTSSERLDQLDAERFRDMLASPPFDILRKRITAELERARMDCERQTNIRDLRRAQGVTSGLRTVLALPEQILKEIESRKRA